MKSSPKKLEYDREYNGHVGDIVLGQNELIEIAVAIVDEYVPLKCRQCNIGGKLDGASVAQAWAVTLWANDVVSTGEAGGSLRDNSGTLLNVPEPLRELFDWEKADLAKGGE
jgi:hypothetical protein